MKRIIRVFPRKTNATPDDALVRIGKAPELFEEADEVHVSVTFTWDLPLAEKLARAWSWVAPVKIGGPATGEKEGQFIPGMYLKKGWVITSRGCNNRCWFCEAWKRNGECAPLKIRGGHIVQDDNLLGCPEWHIRSVFKMLARQSEPADLRGLEAKLLKPWHVELLQSARINQLWFAYDEAADYEPLLFAGRMLQAADFNLTGKKLRSYVLCGYAGDTLEAATVRMHQCLAAGFVPFAMLWRDEQGRHSKGWEDFQRKWTRPAAMWDEIKQYREAV